MEINYQKRDITPRFSGSVDSILLKAVRFRDACAIGQAIIDIILKYDIDLIAIERRLRALDTQVYLIAAPKARALAGQIMIDIKTKEELPYWIWISVNGKKEAEATLKEFGITQEENMVMLKSTGFLAVKE